MMQLITVTIALSSPSALSRMRSYKRRFDLGHSCQIHHIIPRQAFGVRRHLLDGVDIEARANVMLMPSRVEHPFCTRRPLHDGGHMKYNEHVVRRLSACRTAEDIAALQTELRHRLRRGDSTLPWR